MLGTRLLMGPHHTGVGARSFPASLTAAYLTKACQRIWFVDQGVAWRLRKPSPRSTNVGLTPTAAAVCPSSSGGTPLSPMVVGTRTRELPCLMRSETLSVKE